MRKLHSVICLKKALLIALTLCMLCMASACGTDNTDTGTSSGDMAGTGSTRSEDGVLDKGGADGGRVDAAVAMASVQVDAAADSTY